jgi:hypothetical protein
LTEFRGQHGGLARPFGVAAGIRAQECPASMRDWGEKTESVNGKRVAVVGDSDLVCKAIKLALHKRLKLSTGEPDRCGADHPGDAALGWDLIVVAVTSDSAEPIAELAEAGLIDWISRVPLLIISPRPFGPSEEFRIAHLRFPFDPDQLCDRVGDLLRASMELAESILASDVG